MPSLVETPEYQAFRRYVLLTIEKREKEARVKELKETLKAMQPSLLAYFSEASIPSFATEGHTLFPQREPWIYPVTGVSRQQVCEALKIAGLGRMVQENYNTKSLTAYVKQLEEHAKLIVGLEDEDENEPSALRKLLHPALAEIMQVKAAFSLHVRKKEDRYAKYSERAERAERDEAEGDEDDA